MLFLFILIAAAFANETVIVVRERFSFEEEYNLYVDNTIEYMLEFVPNTEQSQYPSKIWIKSNGGEVTHPLLVTARQRVGAVTWQLPYIAGGQLLYEMERTLCIDSADDGNSDCGARSDSLSVPNSFVLHISSSCSTRYTVSVRAAPGRNHLLPFQSSTPISTRLATPAVHYYQFTEGQESVRLELSSEDDVCALVSVQNITCPILQTEEQIRQAGLRMTMLRSGGAHLARSRFPRGFYLVALVLPTDEPCSGVTEEHEDWLWEVIWRQEEVAPRVTVRTKDLLVTLQPSLTRGQYLLATGVTLAFCLLFYVSFLSLVWAQRWPTFHKYVAPRAKLAEREGETVTDSAARGRRRGSTATFDSSDDSNSDDEETGPSPLSSPSSPPLPSSPSSPPTSPSRNPLRGVVEVRAVPTTPPGTPTNEREPTIQPDIVHEMEAPRRDETQGDGEAEVTDGAHAQTTTTSQQGPFGLPPMLRVAALSRGGRSLRVRSDRYLHTLLTVAVFYALPVLQFVTAFQIFLNVSGSLDVCYYNFLCAHPAGALTDFNHVFSNLGYLLLGALFLLQVWRRRRRRTRRPRDEEYGIPAHYGMLSSLGAAMMVVGVLSASYHVCPNQLNFQFDTAFMYVLAAVSMVKIYQSRHADVNARAHATFAVLALLIAIVVWGVLAGGAFFWAIFTVLHLFTFLLLSLRIYYVGQFRLEKQTLQMAARGLAQLPKHGVRPLYRTRLVMLLIANGVNWTMALYGLWAQSGDIASHMLQLLLGNTLLYMVFYMSMKLVHGERPRWYVWVLLGAATAAWAPAVYYFVSGSSDWSDTPAMSRHLNHQCMVLQFYDAHDLWHMLSAVALYLSFNVMLTWDDGLAAVKRTEIAVF